MGLIVLVNERLFELNGALWSENKSSTIDVYFLYRSDIDLDAKPLFKW